MLDRLMPISLYKDTNPVAVTMEFQDCAVSLVPVRIAQLLVMQEALIMAARFCYMLKHDNRGKGWLIPNKTFKTGNGTGLLMARDELQSNEAINCNHLNAE